MDITKINEIIIKLGKFKKPGFHIFKSNSIEIVLNIIKKGDVLGLITIDEKHNPVKSATILEYKDGEQTFRTKVDL